MANNQVVLDPKLLLHYNQTKNEVEHFDPTFDNIVRQTFLREAMKKKAGDIGWEDETKIIPDTGYKLFDKNLDGKITVSDLKLYAPNITNLLTSIEQAIDKPPEENKQVDFNKDNKIDQEDIFTLWANTNLPNLDLLKQAYSKTSNDPNWEDKTEIVKLGYKNADVNLDEEVNDLDKALIFSAIYPNGTLVRSEADNRFMIVSGTKKRIMEDKTIENLGIDKNQIITLTDEELELIPDGEDVPAIKYDNGTLLKVKDSNLD
ncbi:MAG: hypothetical protein AB1414_21175, partial [bacterium]